MVKACDIREVKESKFNIEINLGDNFIRIKGIGNILFEALIPYLSIIKLSYVNRRFKLVMTKKSNWLSDFENILKALVNVIKTNKVVEQAWESIYF